MRRGKTEDRVGLRARADGRVGLRAWLGRVGLWVAQDWAGLIAGQG
jgi:hypothetical protein